MARLSSLERGMRHLNSLDRFGGGMPVDEMFPELAEENDRVGIDFIEPDYGQRKRMIDFKPIDDDVDVLDLANYDDPFFEDEEEYDNRLNADGNEPLFSEQEIEILKTNKNGLLDIVFPNKFVSVDIVHTLEECALAPRFGVVPILMVGGAAICQPEPWVPMNK
jgi:hypothetical protein